MKSVADAHVLFVPSRYDAAARRLFGGAFREQVTAVSELGVKTGLVYPEFRSLRDARPAEWMARRFQIAEGDDDGVPALRVVGWEFPRAAGLTRGIWINQAQRLIKRYVRRHGVPDLIHAHGVHPAGMAALAANQNWRIPYVITECFEGYSPETMTDAMLLQARDVFTRADRIVTSDRASARDIKSYVGGRDIHVIPGFVDTEFFTPPVESRSADPFRFLFVGDLTEAERVEDLLRAFEGAFPPGVDYRLEIGGDGVDRPRVETLAARLELSDRVDFLGPLEREQVRDAMVKANVVVSVGGPVDAVGDVLLAAMSTGLPVIAARGGNVEESVTDQTGRLVDSGDVEEMQRAMQELVSSYDEWQRAGPAIRSHVEENFSARVVCARLIETYNSVIQRA